MKKQIKGMGMSIVTAFTAFVVFTAFTAGAYAASSSCTLDGYGTVSTAAIKITSSTQKLNFVATNHRDAVWSCTFETIPQVATCTARLLSGLKEASRLTPT
jgi:hypothetical protein